VQVLFSLNNINLVITILAIALIGVLVVSASAVAPEAYAAGGLMQLVAYGAQDNPLVSKVPGLRGH
jgi:hypothetical protein